MSKKRVTIHDIAKMSNVSAMTVSRAIRKPEIVQRSTLKRIQNAIETLKYHENVSDKFLSLSTTKTIGICVSSFHKLFSSTFFLDIIKGVEDFAEKNNYGLLVYNAKFDDYKHLYKYALLKEGKVDGMIVYSPYYEETSLDKLKQQNYNIVCLSGYPKTKKIDFVDGDNYGGISLAVEHLVRLGHKRIAFIKGSDHLSNSIDRERAFRDCMKKLELQINEDYIIKGDFSPYVAFESTKSLFELAVPPTAIIAANDKMAIAAVDSLRSLGLKVPEDVAVVGFDDIDMTSFVHPSITTIRQPLYEMGSRACEVLLEKIKGKYKDEIIQEYLPMKLIVRESCGSNLLKRLKK